MTTQVHGASADADIADLLTGRLFDAVRRLQAVDVGGELRVGVAQHCQFVALAGQIVALLEPALHRQDEQRGGQRRGDDDGDEREHETLASPFDESLVALDRGGDRADELGEARVVARARRGDGRGRRGHVTGTLNESGAVPVAHGSHCRSSAVRNGVNTRRLRQCGASALRPR